MYMLTIAKGYNFLLYFILPRSSMALQPVTSEVNNDNLITTALSGSKWEVVFLHKEDGKTGKHRNLRDSENIMAKGLVQFRILSKNQNWSKKGQPVSQGLRETWHQYAQREEGKLGKAEWLFGECSAGESWVLRFLWMLLWHVPPT